MNIYPLQFSLLPHRHINCYTDHYGHHGPDRRRKPHRKQCVRKPDRRQVGQRNPGCYYGGDIVAERDEGIAAGSEETAVTEMNAGEYAVPDISFKVLTAEPDDVAVAREYSYGIFGNELKCHGADDSERDSYRHSIFHSLSGSFSLVGAYVLCRHSRNSRQHRGWRDEQQPYEFLDDSDRRGVVQSPAVSYDRDGYECDLYEAVLQCEGDAGRQDSGHRPHFRPQVIFAYRENGFSPDYEGCKCDTDRLRKRCSKRGSRRAESEMAYEYIVQGNVHNTRHNHEIHRTFGISKTSEYGGDYVVGDYERNADEAYS